MARARQPHYAVPYQVVAPGVGGLRATPRLVHLRGLGDVYAGETGLDPTVAFPYPPQVVYPPVESVTVPDFRMPTRARSGRKTCRLERVENPSGRTVRRRVCRKNGVIVSTSRPGKKRKCKTTCPKGSSRICKRRRKGGVCMKYVCRRRKGRKR